MSFPFIFEASVAIILHGGYFINIIIILFMAVKSDNRYEAKDRPRNHNNLSRRHMIHDILNICFHKYNKIFPCLYLFQIHHLMYVIQFNIFQRIHQFLTPKPTRPRILCPIFRVMDFFIPVICVRNDGCF